MQIVKRRSRILVNNDAIGATGSDLAAFRSQYAGTNIRLAMIGIVPYRRTESA
jgi:hypothetical protein